jgi:hypothetical protein
VSIGKKQPIDARALKGPFEGMTKDAAKGSKRPSRRKTPMICEKCHQTPAYDVGGEIILCDDCLVDLLRFAHTCYSTAIGDAAEILVQMHVLMNRLETWVAEARDSPKLVN